MIPDLHSHSIMSGDGRAEARSYRQWIRTRTVPINGFVLGRAPPIQLRGRAATSGRADTKFKSWRSTGVVTLGNL